jgi:outer membrane protein insertion porin family
VRRRGFLHRATFGLARRSRATRRFVAFSLFLVLRAVPLLAQQVKPSTYEELNGRKISRVDISIRPQMDSTPFRKMIEQKADEPFSNAMIQESTAALKKTKLFSQVQVRITPESAGLRVLFVLRPAYFVGLISFPGATNRFPYTELLQAVNIPNQSAYMPDLLPQGQQALLHFFQTHGYFTATVQPHSETDNAHGIVNFVFEVQLGPEARIGAIHFQGLSEVQANDVSDALASLWARIKRASLRTGQKFSQTRISKATDYIRARLRKSHRLAPLVRLASVSYHKDTNRADLNFEVNPGPFFSVEMTGARVSSGTMRKLVPIYEENSIDQDLIEEGDRNLVSYFQKKGYFDVKIYWHLYQETGQTRVVYEVHRGEPHKVEAIRFEGNHYYDDAKLRPLVTIKKARLFSRGEFTDAMARKSSQAIEALYKNQGFADVKVRTKIDELQGPVGVTFIITEGPQDHVNSLRVTGNKTQSLQALLGNRPLHVEKGKAYSPQDVQRDRNDILAAYLNRGYLNASFKPSVTLENGNPHLLNVVYTITEGPHTFIDNVVLLGAEHTRADFLRQITGPFVTAGQPLSMGKLFAAESDLYNLGIFDWASVGPREPITDQTQSEVLEQVHESKRNTIEYGGGIEVIPRSGNIPVGTVAIPGLPPIGLGDKYTASQKSFVGPRGTFDYTRRNIFGRAESFSASAVVSRLDQRVALSFSDLYFRGSSWSSLISLSGERSTQNPVYAAEVGIASWQFQKPLNAGRTRNLILRYEYNRTILTDLTIPDLVPPEDQHVRLSTFSAEYVRDTRDKPLDAHKGVYQVADFGVTSTPLGSSANFLRFLGQSAFYVPVRPWLTWASNFRLGFATPFAGSNVPLSERFFSGGADSLRGFPIDGAGPQRPLQVCSNPADSSTCSLISVPVGGESLFIFNTEARFPIPWAPFRFLKGLGGAVFYDGGNVYAHINLREMVNNYTNTIGFGLRYNTPVGPIRFDIGHNLNPIPGVNATQYFVTLGQAF